MILNQPFKNFTKTNGSRFITSIRKLCLKNPNFIDFYWKNDHLLYFVRWIFLLTIDKKFLNQHLMIKKKKIENMNMKTVSFLQNQELFSKIPFFSFLTFLFLSLNPCWSFHLFLAETSLSLLTSVVYGFSSSISMCFNTLWTFFWYSGEVFYLVFLAIYYILYLYEAFKHSGTKY